MGTKVSAMITTATTLVTGRWRGRISSCSIQIGSVVGSSGNAGQVNYSAAKAALIGFTVGIIIGASCNNYYHGPYAWRGGGAGAT